MAQQAYDRFIPAGGAVVNKKYKETARYSSRRDGVLMNVRWDAKNERGIGTTWFHEHGHYLDAESGRISLNDDFAQAIVRDCREYEAQYGKAHNLSKVDDVRLGISAELRRQGDVTHSVQDIFGASIGEPYPGSEWGHDESYWEKRGTKALCKETFAHMFEASFDPDKRALMQKYFPTAWAEYQKLLGGIVHEEQDQSGES